MESSDQPAGTVVRGDDGTIYFIRNEILEMTKVTEPEMAAFCAQLLDNAEPETSGFALAAGTQISTLAFSGPFQSPATSSLQVRASSTVMCPGTMHDASFKVLPSFSSGF